MKIDFKIMLVLIVLLTVAGCSDGKWGPFKLNKSNIYFYSNGDSEFEVKKVMDQNYVGYEIKFFYPGNNQSYYLDIRNDPASLEGIPINRTIFNRIKDDANIFITIDPSANLTGKTTVAALEIDKFIDNKYFMNIPVNSSVTKPYSDYPVKSCDDATATSSVIWLKTGDKTQVQSEGNCIIVEGKTEQDIIRGADRLVLYLVGIMP